MSQSKPTVVNNGHTLYISDTDKGYAIEFPVDKIQTGRQRTEILIALMRAAFKELSLCGYLSVSSSDHMAHAMDMEAAWNKVVFQAREDGTIVGIRLVSKLDDYLKGDLTKEQATELQRKDLNSSLGMLNAMAMTMGPISLAMVEAASQFDGKTGAVHNFERVGDV